VHYQSITILAGGKCKRVARLQQREQVTVVIGSGPVDRLRARSARGKNSACEEGDAQPGTDSPRTSRQEARCGIHAWWQIAAFHSRRMAGVLCLTFEGGIATKVI
jgi:hypothetical protein